MSLERVLVVGVLVVVSAGTTPAHRNRLDAQVRPGSKSRAQVHGFLRNVGDPVVSIVGFPVRTTG
jgi:hypothetical protein